MDAALWTIPADRMKAGKDHVVPLSEPAMAVLRDAHERRDGSGFLFPSARRKALGVNSLTTLAKAAGIPTVHGLRSSFRDWAGETGEPRELAEAALAHTLPSVEAAYARSTMIERRRGLMARWAAYVA